MIELDAFLQARREIFYADCMLTWEELLDEKNIVAYAAVFLLFTNPDSYSSYLVRKRLLTNLGYISRSAHEIEPTVPCSPNVGLLSLLHKAIILA